MVDASHVYVRALALGCFCSNIRVSTRVVVVVVVVVVQPDCLPTLVRMSQA